MAYTTGGATSHSLTVDMGAMFGGPGSIGFCAGWWMPTTLTNGRCLWAAGATTGAYINSTTSQVRIKYAAATAWEWTVAAQLAVNKWTFLAFAMTCAGTTPGVRVWMGETELAPTELGLTVAVTGSGDIASSTSLRLGNTTAANVSFQGDIDSWVVANVDGPLSGQGPLGIAAAGTITNDEAAVIRDRLVTPIWQGKIDSLFVNGSGREFGSNLIFGRWYAPLMGLGVQIGWEHNTSTSANPPFWPITVTGATVSQRRCPHARVSAGLLPDRRR